ncbi:ANTAR domain-containing protein [Streptomyces sp. NPDC018045]|uniref:ANTAR domain-containing protein n=1 Tax=Streptomyces sp. NPDC018045 TaxID=3365037 RepID=UPI0037A0B50E
MPEPARRTPPFTELDAERATDRITAVSPAPEPCLLALEVTADGERTRVTVLGELDLETGRHIEPGLHAALGASFHGLDLHLGAVRFCDCAGLGALLRLRTRALKQNKTVTIRTSNHAIDRLLDLTGTRGLFDGPAPNDRPAAPFPAGTHEEDDQDLRTEVAQLRRAMQTRPVIDLARGILMSTFNLSPEAAWNVLVAASQNTNTKLHRLAQSLVDSLQGTALPEATQNELLTAVTSVDTAPPTEPGTPPRRRRGTVPGQRCAPPDA